jgi:hypothetical protein
MSETSEWTQKQLREPASWVIRDKVTRKPLAETFDKRIAEAINTEKYQAVPIIQHLAELTA